MTELLVVFAIIAVLATMLMTGFIRMQQNSKLASATDRVISHLQTARAMAINHGKVYSYHLDYFKTLEQQYSMCVLPFADLSLPLDQQKRYDTHSIDRSIQVKNGAGLTQFSIHFNPDGSAVGSTTEISLFDTGSTHTRTVQIYQGGMIRLKRDK